MADDLDWRLLDRHLAGEASPGDEVALQHWLAADPARERMLRDLTSVARNPRHADWDTGRAWARISARLDEPRLTLHLERRPPAQPRARVWITVGVAALAVGSLIIFVWWPEHARRQATDGPVSVTAAAPQARATLRGGTTIDGARDALVFNDITLAQAASEIGRHFGVRVDIADPALAARHLSARFGDEPLPRVLETISAALGARWTRAGDRVLLEEAH